MKSWWFMMIQHLSTRRGEISTLHVTTQPSHLWHWCLQCEQLVQVMQVGTVVKQRTDWSMNINKDWNDSGAEASASFPWNGCHQFTAKKINVSGTEKPLEHGTLVRVTEWVMPHAACTSKTLWTHKLHKWEIDEKKPRNSHIGCWESYCSPKWRCH